jgi:hypothetical protein
MRRIYNYLMDVMKVVGGSSEAFWLLINRGMAILGREGVDMPQAGTPEYTAMQDEMDEYQHQLRRILRLRGVDIQELGGNVVDGGGQVDVLVTIIAGAIKTPKRILMGSERGELASTQDDKNFADVCKSRQDNFCAPMMVKPLIKRFTELGMLPLPSNGIYTLKYPSLFELNQLEKGQYSVSKATAISTITAGAPETAVLIEDFMRDEFGYTMPKELTDIQDSKLESTQTGLDNATENLANGNNPPTPTEAGAQPTTAQPNPNAKKNGAAA